ncbi:MAG: c-type cytochrome biogenesis protein CcmI, partial [Lysobacterales bacterium]
MNAAQLWFWATAALFTLLALGFVLCPLLRARPAAGISRKSLNIAIYRERAQGPAEYLNVEEAGQRLLQDATGTELAAAVVAQNGRRWPWIVGAALVLPLLAFGAYFQADTWRLLGSSREQPPVEYLLNRLRERVAATPEDADAHLLLA